MLRGFGVSCQPLCEQRELPAILLVSQPTGVLRRFSVFMERVGKLCLFELLPRRLGITAAIGQRDRDPLLLPVLTTSGSNFIVTLFKTRATTVVVCVLNRATMRSYCHLPKGSLIIPIAFGYCHGLPILSEANFTLKEGCVGK